MTAVKTSANGWRAAVERWLLGVWYSRSRPPFWLLPFSRLFALLAQARRFVYRAGWRKIVRLNVPVVVIGNIAVGGTGKTPVAIYIARLLRDMGRRPGIVTRGYGGAGNRRQPLPAEADSDPRFVGDEAVLLARRTACPVMVGRNRAAAAAALLEQHDVDVIIADDGLQHYRLARDLEIVVVDAQRGHGNGMLLPAGPLREPVNRLRDGVLVICNGEGAPAGCADAVRMQLRQSEARNLATGERRLLQAFAGKRVHAVAGIGNPERFFAGLAEQRLDVITHALPDHAQPARADIWFADELPVLMTEKDAVKCAAIVGQRHWVVTADPFFNPTDAARIKQVLQLFLQQA